MGSPKKTILPILLLSILVIGYLTGLAVGPRVSYAQIQENNLWLLNVKLNDQFGISLNLDSLYYMQPAKTPSLLLEDKHYLQSRPLLPLLAYYPVQLFEFIVFDESHARLTDRTSKYYVAPFLFYVSLNLILLFLSYMLFLRIIHRYAMYKQTILPQLSILHLPVVLGLTLIFNDISKAFFYSAHTQFFNIFTPLVSILIVLHIYQAKKIHYPSMLLLSFTIGILLLGYGSFLVCGFAILASICAKFFLQKNLNVRQVLFICAACLAILSIPSIAWYSFVKTQTGGFYSLETQKWNQVIWVLDYKTEGIFNILLHYLNNAWFFLKSAITQSYSLLLLLLVALLLSKKTTSDFEEFYKQYKATINWILALIFIYIAFFSLVGYQVERLAFPLVVYLTTLAAIFLQHIAIALPKYKTNILLVTCWIVVLFQGIFSVVKNGPFL